MQIADFQLIAVMANFFAYFKKHDVPPEVVVDALNNVKIDLDAQSVLDKNTNGSESMIVLNSGRFCGVLHDGTILPIEPAKIKSSVYEVLRSLGQYPQYIIEKTSHRWGLDMRYIVSIYKLTTNDYVDYESRLVLNANP